MGNYWKVTAMILVTATFDTETHKIVPIEPTEDMFVAFAEQWFSKIRTIDDCAMEDCYRAMLFAAPDYPMHQDKALRKLVKESERLGFYDEKLCEDCLPDDEATSFLSEIIDPKGCIPKGKLAYFQERLRNKLYDFIVSQFLDKERKHELTIDDLARRLNKKPKQITRWFASPSNWKIDTISDLMLGICRAEMDFSVKVFTEIKPPRSIKEEKEPCA